jgi:hypothetical protein
MRYTRLLVTTVAAAIVDVLYGLIVYNAALAGEVQVNSAVYRPIAAVNANLPYFVVSVVLAVAAAAWIYARYVGDGDGGLLTGLAFGLAVGVFCVGYVAIGNFVVMKLGKRLTLYLAAAQLGEWIAVGSTLGLVYKPVRR